MKDSPLLKVFVAIVADGVRIVARLCCNLLHGLCSHQISCLRLFFFSGPRLLWYNFAFSLHPLGESVSLSFSSFYFVLLRNRLSFKLFKVEHLALKYVKESHIRNLPELFDLYVVIDYFLEIYIIGRVIFKCSRGGEQHSFGLEKYFYIGRFANEL